MRFVDGDKDDVLQLELDAIISQQYKLLYNLNRYKALKQITCYL